MFEGLSGMFCVVTINEVNDCHVTINKVWGLSQFWTKNYEITFEDNTIIEFIDIFTRPKKEGYVIRVFVCIYLCIFL